MDQSGHATGLILVDGDVEAQVLACREGLSFWGGVDPESGRIIDAHHPQQGRCVSGKVLMMPTSRGSCSGSGVLLELALNGRAPAAMIFCEDEEVLTLGALVAEKLFGKRIPTLRLGAEDYGVVARSETVTIREGRLQADSLTIDVAHADVSQLTLSDPDRAFLRGDAGDAARMAMEIICLMAIAQQAPCLLDVTRGHIDGCILAHSANLIFAEKMAEIGSRVAIPTTINAISVDREGWRETDVVEEFGARASRLADAYVSMGARPTFTCAPYLLDDAPKVGECIGWSESNAVIFANSVLGARTSKHPDYLDLCIAMTGRAPNTGVYTDHGRAARRRIVVTPPNAHDDTFWPLMGWFAGKLSPDRIPLLTGLEGLSPRRDDLKAMCAAFGTTSGAPMLHVRGQTPEGDREAADDADEVSCGPADLAAAWQELNSGGADVDLVAIGSPHASYEELVDLEERLHGQRLSPGMDVIVTVGRDELARARDSGVTGRLEAVGVRLLPDLCWCSITEPVFPQTARGLMTNSGKYAHYAFGLSGRKVRFGGLDDCVQAALTGRAPDGPPSWLSE